MYDGLTIIANPSPVAARSEEHLWRSISLGADSIPIRATSGARVTAKTAMGYPPLWRAINLISSSVAGLPFDVFRRQRDGGKRVDLRHPAQVLLDRAASPYINAYTFRRTMTSLALLYGNAYASIDRVEGRPISLSIWNPANTIVRVMEGEIYYITYFNNEAVRVTSRDMLHIRGLGPDGIVGYPILDLMADAMGVGMAAMEFGARFFGQGSNMSGLLMIPGHFTEEKIRNTMQAWNSMQSGLTQSHKVALIQDGVKFQQLQISPDQAQFLQTREHEIRATVSNITGVPPHMLGDSTRTSHNSLESEGQSYLDYTLQPWLKTWENECEDKLLTEQQKEADSHLIEFNREALIQMSFEAKVNGLYRQLEAGIINHNEARALLNMPTLGEDGDARYRPANWMEIGSPAEEMAEGEDEEEDDSPESPATTPPQAPDETTAAITQLVTAGITKACELEAAKAVQIAGRRAGDFMAGVEDFYRIWAEHTLAGLESAAARQAIQAHADASLAALDVVNRHATPDTLRAQVEAAVAMWQQRKADLIARILGSIRNAPAKYDGIDFTPPQAVRTEAQRGLDWRREHGRGGTEVGIARARDLSNGVEVSPETIGRMVSYFARHEVDKQGEGWSQGEDGYPSNGRIAWALWGGDPGRAWANKVSRQMKARDK
jgi:HK97 family phage portal protein